MPSASGQIRDSDDHAASVILRTSEETFLIVTNRVDRQNFCDNDPKKAHTATLNARLSTNDESP